MNGTLTRLSNTVTVTLILFFNTFVTIYSNKIYGISGPLWQDIGHYAILAALLLGIIFP
jgi:hypothetical protein